MKHSPESNASFFSSLDIIGFRQQFISRYNNGRQLLEEMDKFAALARQLLLTRKRLLEKKEEEEAKRNAARPLSQQEQQGNMDVEEVPIRNDDDDDDDEQKQDLMNELHSENDVDSEDRNGDDGSEGTQDSDDPTNAASRRHRALAALKSGLRSGQKQLPVTVDDEQKKLRMEGRIERTKRRLMGNQVVKEMREYLEESDDEQRPELIQDWRTTFDTSTSNDFKHEEIRRRYEESHFVRLSQTRAERKVTQRHRQSQLQGNELDRLLQFDSYTLPDGGSSRLGRGGASRAATQKRGMKTKKIHNNINDGSIDAQSGPEKKRMRHSTSFGTKNRGKPKRRNR